MIEGRWQAAAMGGHDFLCICGVHNNGDNFDRVAGSDSDPAFNRIE